tara:strand:- start:354 stop:602 length:249 start_codon:yes stop_codon:yes gene_type:complete
MSDFSILRLKALLLDTITVLKFGSHLAPNSKAAKDELCKQLGQKTTISNSQLLNGIGLVYKDNNMEDDYWRIIDKFKAEKYL